MINAINGYDIIGNSLKSQKLNDEVEKFLSKGNKVKVLGGSFVKKIKPVIEKPIKGESITGKRRASRVGYRERLSHQQSVLKDYLSWYKKSNKWKYLAYNCSVKVCSSHFHLILDGVCTISNQEKWDDVEAAINKIKIEMNVA